MDERNRYQRCAALMLKVDPRGEKDLEATVLYLDWGKGMLRAPGARASRKGTAAVLQHGFELELLVYRSRGHDTLQQAEIKRAMTGVSEPQRLLCLHYLLWLTDAWCPLGGPAPQIYALLKSALVTLESLPNERLETLKRRFERALLQREGLWTQEQGLTFLEFRAVFEMHAQRAIPSQFLC